MIIPDQGISSIFSVPGSQADKNHIYPDPLHLLPEFRCQGGALVFHLRQPLLELPQRLGYRGQAQFRGAIGLFRLLLQGIRRQGPELVGELFAVRGDVRGSLDGGVAFRLGACRAGE